jgi:hypothetical protein
MFMTRIVSLGLRRSLRTTRPLEQRRNKHIAVIDPPVRLWKQ